MYIDLYMYCKKSSNKQQKTNNFKSINQSINSTFGVLGAKRVHNNILPSAFLKTDNFSLLFIHLDAVSLKTLNALKGCNVFFFTWTFVWGRMIIFFSLLKKINSHLAFENFNLIEIYFFFIVFFTVHTQIEAHTQVSLIIASLYNTEWKESRRIVLLYSPISTFFFIILPIICYNLTTVCHY